MNPEAIEELQWFADNAIEQDFCSCLLPAFVRGIQEDTGLEPCAEIRQFAAMLETNRMHYSPETIRLQLLQQLAGMKQQT